MRHVKMGGGITPRKLSLLLRRLEKVERGVSNLIGTTGASKATKIFSGETIIAIADTNLLKQRFVRILTDTDKGDEFGGTPRAEYLTEDNVTNTNNMIGLTVHSAAEDDEIAVQYSGTAIARAATKAEIVEDGEDSDDVEMIDVGSNITIFGTAGIVKKSSSACGSVGISLESQADDDNGIRFMFNRFRTSNPSVYKANEAPIMDPEDENAYTIQGGLVQQNGQIVEDEEGQPIVARYPIMYLEPPEEE